MIVPVEGVPANGEDATGGRPRSGRMESSIDCFIAPVTDAEGVWHICTAFRDYLCSRNLQGVPPPSRAIRFRVGMAGEELPIPNLAVFHRMVRIGLRSFALCCKLKSTWILLKPHVDSLVANFALPQLTFNVSKQAMCEADPVEYVRASVDEHEHFSSPVSGATSFLSLANNRTKTSFLPMLQFINTALCSNPTPSSALQHPYCRAG
ncbi:hypothetical protein BD769DRAFT_411178 [Suillus cothurnatus]|nr:hypothetical protein BD769DRAFT_411178 [Suillus cothurnatus]